MSNFERLAKQYRLLGEGEEDEYSLDDLGYDDPADAIVSNLEGTDLPTYSYKTFELFLEFSYSSKQPLLIYGDPGLGKSQIIHGFAKKMAAEKGKTFLGWNDASPEEKAASLKDPSKYFCLMDVRTAQIEPTEIQGIPKMGGKEKYLETLQPKWIYYMAQEGADGILFLDELNQGHEQVLKALFQVILDRTAYETKFSPDVAIVAAGNLGSEFGNQPLPVALTNRFTAGVLVADPESWLEWAQRSGIDDTIIAFVSYEPELNFYTKPAQESDPFPTPRAITTLSHAIKDIKKYYLALKKKGQRPTVGIYEAIANKAAGLCGATWARKYVAFLTHIKQFDWATLVQEAPNLQNYKKDKLWAAIAYMFSVLKRNMEKTGEVKTPENMKVMGELVQILTHLNDEWALIFVKWVKNQDDGDADVKAGKRPNIVNSFLKWSTTAAYDEATKTKWNSRRKELFEYLK